MGFVPQARTQGDVEKDLDCESLLGRLGGRSRRSRADVVFLDDDNRRSV